MPKDATKIPAAAMSTEVDEFLRQIAATPTPARAPGMGRLIFAIDATASRQPTWDRACQIQAEMFSATASLGGLAIRLCYFRGFGEFHASPWLTESSALVGQMTSVTCLAGTTQIARVLRHAIDEAGRLRVNALVYIGDAMEEGEDGLAELAGKLGLLGVPAFIFQEGSEARAERAFRQIARLTRGAYMRFDAASAGSLRDLLNAVAVYAAGGQKALAEYAQRAGGEALLLTRQLK
jgi:hypothetical protein